MARNFDLIVVGGGSGGLAGAFRAAGHGARVAMLEPGALGGTCVNAGCVPKKAMWLAAEVARKLTMAGDLGFATETCALDWPEFIAHRQRYINNIHESYRRRLDEAGIAVLPMRGRLTGPGTVECEDGVSLSASRLLIATGGHAVKPPIAGAELGGTSDDFFHWTAPPDELAIVGGGYVAVELAGVMQALGSRVSMFVRGPRLLEAFDQELCDRLAEDYRHAGVRLHFDCEVESVEGEGDRRRVRGGGADQGTFDTVLFATGRAPNTDGLGLDAAGVDTDTRGRILVDDRHSTSAAGVYAVGDVTTDPALTPVAIAAARRLMERLYGGRSDTLDLSQVPTVVFTHPPLGKVGLTEAEARESHDDVEVYTTGFRPMLHSLAESQQRSLFKLVCVGSERRVVGLHLLGDAADEILQGFAVAIKRGITLDDLHDTVAIHPTSAEEVVLLR
ncbi:glutathione-disulfide reductase [Novilysobacter selenitireducens]|uniref:Glutathione-disulfide reductase n=1 Tax=Novilysobacter selenitireducens TaxID=2872639 RepID=A0ABS7T929_9GAMM|nr:glutathione-disulfide reductase [Lysobacter selenitireducens]MBZ4040370.1 glutathione-disulfide reductase [Lysobacter selenitireducens]